MAASIVRRIFANRPLPPTDASEEEFKKQFDAAVTDFENSGFLEANKFPAISSEMELVEKLHEHKNDLLILKFWKRGCLPCMGLSEMYKAAEQHFQGKRVHFYSVNTKEPSCFGTVAHQLVEGTPTMQIFHQGRQIEDEVMAMSLNSFVDKVEAFRKKYGLDK